jgi:hypothetical protein
MVTGRTHRNELFSAPPGASVEEARAQLTAAHEAMKGEHPDAYSARADMRWLSVRPIVARRRGRSCSCCSPRPRLCS